MRFTWGIDFMDVNAIFDLNIFYFKRYKDCMTCIQMIRSVGKHKLISQRAHDAYTTSPQRRCNVMTLHRRCGDVVLTSCACWGSSSLNVIYAQGRLLPDCAYASRLVAMKQGGLFILSVQSFFGYTTLNPLPDSGLIQQTTKKMRYISYFS